MLHIGRAKLNALPTDHQRAYNPPDPLENDLPKVNIPVHCVNAGFDGWARNCGAYFGLAQLFRRRAIENIISYRYTLIKMANTPPLRGANSSEQLRFTSGELRFEEIISPDVLKRAYELRYRICVEKLKWVEGHPDSKLEWDEFDEYSYHFGCFSDGILVGYMRMTKENTPAGIMSRKYFGELWEKDPRYDPEHSADVSRLVVDGTQIAMKQFPSVFAGLYRLAYGRSHLCRPPIRYIYLITTPRILTGLRWKLALPVKVLGKGITSDGKETIAASIDLEKSKRKMLLLAPWRMHKFHKVMKHATPSSVKLDN